jgi:FSR family fosmidomycin resistance protein-like MFS transporter
MALFLYFQSIYILAILGFFIFAPAPVLMALVQDSNSSMPTFMHSIYMGINFGLSSIIVLLIGYLGDNIGLNQTFMICNILGLGSFIVTFVMIKKLQ